MNFCDRDTQFLMQRHTLEILNFLCSLGGVSSEPALLLSSLLSSPLPHSLSQDMGTGDFLQVLIKCQDQPLSVNVSKITFLSISIPTSTHRIRDHPCLNSTQTRRLLKNFINFQSREGDHGTFTPTICNHS